MLPSQDQGSWGELLAQADAAYAERRLEHAEHLYELAADATQVALGPHAPEVFSILDRLMHLQYCDLGSYARTEPVARRILALREEQLGPDHPGLSDSLIALGHACQHAGKDAEAEAAFRRAATLTEQGLGLHHPNTVAARGQLIQYLWNAHKDAALEALLRPLVEGGAEEAGVAPPLGALVELYVRQERWAEAEPLYRRLIEQANEATPGRRQHLVFLLSGLARAYRALGRGEEALRLYEQALMFQEAEQARLLATVRDDTATRAIRNGQALLLAGLLRPYAEELHAQGRLGEAEAAYKRGQGLIEDVLGAEEERSIERGQPPAQGSFVVVLRRELARLLAAYAGLLRQTGRTEANAVASRAATLQEEADGCA